MKLEWHYERVPLDKIDGWQRNPVNLSKKAAERLEQSFDEFDQMQTVALSPIGDGRFRIVDGHQRAKVLQGDEVHALVANRELTEREHEKAFALLRTATGSIDWDLLSAWDFEDLGEWGFDADMLKGLNNDANNLKELLASEEPESVDAEPQIDRAEELREKWGVESGDLWHVGEHRIICGDCTDRAVVDRLMGGEKAVLIHADPPYGMGKEKDGIANDNLYREKLDAFQMAWWSAWRGSIEDNGSAYIWGNAEDLWRLWYSGGLKDSERLTFRNEIVWDKGDAGAGGISHQGADGLRLYPNSTERALFFMLGEQGFNNNADNYWEGWDSVLEYLQAEAEKVSLTASDVQRVCGVGMYGHWFTKSQWTFIPEHHYKALQKEYDGFKKEYDELKKEYDELKKEFYATRAYFDNTHDNMTDVWNFQRVQGEDRHGHATPKPVEMMERVIKSSSRKGDIVAVPFGGTSPEMVAAENLGRRVFSAELNAGYLATTLQRMADAFPHLDIYKAE